MFKPVFSFAVFQSCLSSALSIGNRGYLVTIYDDSDLLKKQIASYITKSMLPIFEVSTKFSYSLEEVKKKRDEVFEWLDEVAQKTRELQNVLKTTKDPGKIFESFGELQEKIGHDDRFTDFVHTLTIIIQEHEIYRIQESRDKLKSIFDNMKLHPAIRKASEKLFEDGHYASAILEAYKALNNYVKRRSKRRRLDGRDLMSKVFCFRYNPETDQIERKPVLQLNELCNRSEQDEQEGFMFLFMGAMQGIRNPKAHDLIEQKDPYKTLQYLSIASLLAKRVDEAKSNA